MTEQTELQERVAAALAESRALEQERKDELAAAKVAGELRIAAKEAEKQRLQAEQQEALRQRRENRQKQEQERLRRISRANFAGTDADFDKLWPSILERITTQEVMMQRHRPKPL